MSRYLSAALLSLLAPVAHAGVIGWVDATPTAGTSFQVAGWACSTGVSQSISVHVYVGGPAGTGTIVAMGVADQASSAGISTSCGTSGVPHRYLLTLPASVRQQHANKLIYVHGISPNGGSNLLLSGSGVFRVPAPLSVTRTYSYNDQLELCKVVEPETGATLMEYDAAGNLSWSASGLPAATECGSTDASVVARKKVSTYDVRNRIATLAFPDGRGNLTYDYDAAGQLELLTVDNGGNEVVRTQYVHNRRGFLEREVLMWTNANINWPVYYTYDDLGHLSAQNWHGQTIDYAPNALGLPTRAGSYATGAKYYPNGAMKEFTYGNGIVHTMKQNRRQLPEGSLDSYVSGGTAVKVVDDTYDYDYNGNVAAITDGATGRSQRGNRTMTYDNLGRLKRAQSAMFGSNASSAAAYSYDGVDNLTRVTINSTPTVPGRDQYYCYDAQSQRLTNVMTGGCGSGGSTVIGLDYDDQGNLKNKNGQGFEFDFGNRLRRVATAADATIVRYVYDGQGRRVRDWTTAGSKYSQYSQSGQILQTSDARAGVFSEYIYLAGSLVAVRERTGTSGSYVYANKYQHTDAIGSPVAVTDDSRSVLERTEYEPFGKVLAPSAPGDELGFAGHAFDASIGMNYMQQRYYDPQIGRFLSVDPFDVDRVTGYGFNRYWYADNSPFVFFDPDGRSAIAKFMLSTAAPAIPTGTPPTTMPEVEVRGTRPSPVPWGGLLRPWLTSGLARLAGGVGLYLHMEPILVPSCEAPGQPANACAMANKVPDVPPVGPPGQWINGRRRSRLYGPDGRPRVDIDNPHQGADYPHVHEWENGVREHPGREVPDLPPPQPGEVAPAE